MCASSATDLPKNLEGYYQETGRAGRDGLPAERLAAFGLQDVVLQRRLIDGSEGDSAHRRRLARPPRCHARLLRDRRLPPGVLLGYFGEAARAVRQLRHVPVAAPSWDGTVAAQKLLSAVYRLRRERHQRFGAAR